MCPRTFSSILDSFISSIIIALLASSYRKYFFSEIELYGVTSYLLYDYYLLNGYVCLIIDSERRIKYAEYVK